MVYQIRREFTNDFQIAFIVCDKLTKSIIRKLNISDYRKATKGIILHEFNVKEHVYSQHLRKNMNIENIYVFSSDCELIRMSYFDLINNL